MAVAVFEDALLGSLFGDEVVARAFASERTVRRYNEVEAALTRAAQSVGLVPDAAADALVALLGDFAPDLSDVAEGTLRDGMPLPRYAALLKAAAGEHARHAHLGSTSQDIIDTALALALAEVNAIYAERLDGLCLALDRLSAEHGRRALMGRTRMQAALPITVADRIRGWAAPLRRERERLDRLRPRVELLQFGGPVGTRRGWDGHGDEIAAHMAQALGLTDPGEAWHTVRDGLGAHAAWLTQVSAALGKVGQDVCLMAQQGIGEVRLAGGGGSSAMAHKRNPIDAELLITLARYNAAQLGGFAQSLVHEQERSGVSWALEWMILPPMCVATGCGLLTAQRLLDAVEVIGAPEGTVFEGDG